MSLKSGKLAHPIIEEVEYIDVKKGGVLLKSYGRELENKTWRQFQLLIGKEIGTDRYHYQYKKKNDTLIHKGQINGVNLKKEPDKITKADEGGLVFVKESIKEINNRLDGLKGSDLGTDIILQVTRENYQMQITFLNREIDKKETIIIKLESKVEDLESELSSIDESSGQVSIMEVFKVIQEFKQIRSGKLTAEPVNLSSSNQSDIPPEILELLGAVDWGRVEPELKKMIVDMLSQYIKKLPMKG